MNSSARLNIKVSLKGFVFNLRCSNYWLFKSLASTNIKENSSWCSNPNTLKYRWRKYIYVMLCWTNKLQWYIVALIFSWQPPAHRLSASGTKLLMRCSIDRVYPSSSSVLYFNFFSLSDSNLVHQLCKGLLPWAPRPIDRLVGYDWLGALLLLTLRLSRISKENFNQSGIYPLVDSGLQNQ